MKKKPARKNTPKDIETQVLVNSRRRCCLCVFLKNDLSRQKGQIAHLDQDRANFRLGNLAFLCTDHHDEYDSKTSQVKNLTIKEVKEYRGKWLQIVAKEDVSISFPRAVNREESGQSAVSSGRLLGRILEAFDREFDGLERHNRPNGIALCHLATVAATEEGDFLAAEEAFLSLIRLAGECERRGMQLPSINPPVTTADLISAAERTLCTFFTIDFALSLGALHRVRELAVFGDTKFSEIDISTHAVAPAFFPLGQVLCRVGRTNLGNEQKWAAELTGETLAQMLLSAVMLLSLQGVSLPPPREISIIDCGGRGTSPESADKRMEPFVWAATRIAMFASPAFDAAVKSLVFRMGVAGIGIDKDQGLSMADMRASLYRWAALPSHALIVGCSVKTPGGAEECQSLLQRLKTTGTNAASAAQDYVRKERELVLSRGNR